MAIRRVVEVFDTKYRPRLNCISRAHRPDPQVTFPSSSHSPDRQTPHDHCGPNQRAVISSLQLRNPLQQRPVSTRVAARRRPVCPARRRFLLGPGETSNGTAGVPDPRAERRPGVAPIAGLGCGHAAPRGLSQNEVSTRAGQVQAESAAPKHGLHASAHLPCSAARGRSSRPVAS
jgi:hypothetical protein